MKKYQFIKIIKSNDNKTKYTAIFKNRENGKIKNVKFGAYGYKDYIQYYKENKEKAIAKKRSYLARHSARENWSDRMSKGYLSAFLLWNKPTFKESYKWVKNDLKKNGY